VKTLEACPAPGDWSFPNREWLFPLGHSITVTLAAGLLIAVSLRAPCGAMPLRLVVGRLGVCPWAMAHGLPE
jgi:membrane-associated phospholipid phosphatase